MQNKKCVIIQARTDSRRLPGKVLLKIEGKPMLWHVINRIKKINVKEMIVATTGRKIDDDIVTIANNFGLKSYRGKTNDVLDRFYCAAKESNAEIIIRITADCPLIDPNESKKVLKKFISGKYDYASNDSETYPNGLDTECFTFKALEDAWKGAKLKSEREHVTPYIWKNPKRFKICLVNNKKKDKKIRSLILASEEVIDQTLNYPVPYKEVIWRTPNDQMNAKNTCLFGQIWVHINSNGDIYPCSQLWNTPDKFQPKNVKIDGFDSALENTRNLKCKSCFCLAPAEWRRTMTPKGMLKGARVTIAQSLGI